MGSKLNLAHITDPENYWERTARKPV